MYLNYIKQQIVLYKQVIQNNIQKGFIFNTIRCVQVLNILENNANCLLIRN